MQYMKIIMKNDTYEILYNSSKKTKYFSLWDWKTFTYIPLLDSRINSMILMMKKINSYHIEF